LQIRGQSIMQQLIL